jgi:alpha-1,6-mannosyltransferase
MKERKWSFISLSLLVSTCYILLTYFIKRHESIQLLSLYAILFFTYLYINLKAKAEDTPFYIWLSVFISLTILFAVPSLSDDLYRFIWDGRLLQAGIHPFAAIPSYYAQHNFQVEGLSPELYTALNSKEYFTIYPPVAQGIFWLATFFSKSIYGSLLVMKVLILVSQIVSIILIQKILRQVKLPGKYVLLYCLNPLVILELTGNVHFEAFVVVFLLASFYYLQKNNLTLSALHFSLAVCIKLLPLLFLPSLLFYIGWKKSIRYYLVVGVVCVLLFIPLLNQEIITGLSTSLSYYFKKFEFNASLYYLVREWGYWQYGYNIIQTVGWKLGLISALLICSLTFYRLVARQQNKSNQQIFTDWSIVLLIYLLFTTTVHPWYIIPLLAFSVFTQLKFPIVWSFFIFLTYAGYTENSFFENYWITALGYVVVITVALIELIPRFKPSSAKQLAHDLQ